MSGKRVVIRLERKGDYEEELNPADDDGSQRGIGIEGEGSRERFGMTNDFVSGMLEGWQARTAFKNA